MVRVLALLILLAAVPAYAELTAPENADVRRLVESSKNLRSAERYLAESIRCCSTKEARVALAHALGLFHSAQIEHWRGLAFLLHTGTENPEPLPVMTPEQWLERAWFHLDRYRLRLDEIGKALTSAQAHHVANAEYQDNLRRARDIWLDYATTNAKLDRALLYRDPHPALRPGKTIPTVVAVHGDYRLMQWFGNRGKNYALDSYEALIAAYRKNAAGARIRDAWVQSSNMLDALDRATALLADVTFTPEEAAEDRFCRALRATKILTVEAAQRYQAWAGVVSGFVAPPFDAVVAKLADSWKHAVDLATWEALTFPESGRCPGF